MDALQKTIQRTLRNKRNQRRFEPVLPQVEYKPKFRMGLAPFVPTPTYPDAMLVEGAGTTAVNDVYLRDGDLNGKPSFVFGDYLLQNREDYLFDSNGLPVLVDGSQTFNNWNFYDTVGENAPYYGDTNDRNVENPSEVSTWDFNTAVFGTDNPTVPTVRYATWADIDAAGIDRSTVPLLE